MSVQENTIWQRAGLKVVETVRNSYNNTSWTLYELFEVNGSTRRLAYSNTKPKNPENWAKSKIKAIRQRRLARILQLNGEIDLLQRQATLMEHYYDQFS